MKDAIQDQGFCYLVCKSCERLAHKNFAHQVKLAKNKGSYFKTEYPHEWLSEFLMNHSDCDISQIVVEWEK